MIRRFTLLQWWLTSLYFSIPFVAFVLATYIRFGTRWFSPAHPDMPSYTVMALLSTIVWAVAIEYYKLNRLPIRTFGVTSAAKATAITTSIVLASGFFYRGTAFSRVVVLSVAFCLFAGSVMIRRVFFSDVLFRAVARRARIAVIGADDFAQMRAVRVAENGVVSATIKAFVEIPDQTASPDLQAPVYKWDELYKMLEIEHPDEVLIAVRLDQLAAHPITEELQDLCIPVRLALDIGNGLFNADAVNNIGGIPIVDLHRYPVETVRYALAKRAFDIAFSLVAILVTAPLMFIIAAAIKLTSSGPVFFTQERIGLKGEHFQMLKFRSMVVNATAHEAHTAYADPRVTSVGRLLRKTNFDELPQFFNVLKGKMSVVGPRPELTFFVHKFRHQIPSYMARHNVKCGITGWAQVHGLRGNTSIARRIEYDLEYMHNWSLTLDMKIILMTVLSGFSGEETQ
jgi:Undecaprenyl-phosphate glucose phosphotransferase